MVISLIKPCVAKCYNIKIIRITLKDRILRRRTLCIVYEDELSINDYCLHYERNIETSTTKL